MVYCECMTYIRAIHFDFTIIVVSSHNVNVIPLNIAFESNFPLTERKYSNKYSFYQNEEAFRNKYGIMNDKNVSHIHYSKWIL